MPNLHFRYGTQWDWEPYNPAYNLGGEGGIQQYAMGEQKVHFDGPNKYIVINAGYTEIDVQNDIYSAWKEWIQNLDNSKYLQAITAIGGDPITDVTAVGITYFLENGWRIKLPEADGDYVITGNLYTREPGQSPYISPDADFDTTVEFVRSNIVDLITISGDTSLSNADISAISFAVWEVMLTDIATPDTIGTHLKNKMLKKGFWLGLKD